MFCREFYSRRVYAFFVLFFGGKKCACAIFYTIRMSDSMQSRKDLDHFPNLSLERVEAGREAQQCASLLEFITQITCAHMMMITMTSMMMMIVIKNLDNNQHY